MLIAIALALAVLGAVGWTRLGRQTREVGRLRRVLGRLTRQYEELEARHKASQAKLLTAEQDRDSQRMSRDGLLQLLDPVRHAFEAEHGRPERTLDEAMDWAVEVLRARPPRPVPFKPPAPEPPPSVPAAPPPDSLFD